MTEQAQFIVSHRDGVGIVEVSGDVDITNITSFQNAVRQAAGEGSPGIVLSLRKVGYIDSRMIHELFTLSKRTTQSRRLLSVVFPDSASARYILEAAGVPKMLTIHASIDAGVDFVKTSGQNTAQ